MVTPFSTFTGTNKSLLTNALLSANSGITVNTSSITLNASAQSAVNFYDGSLGALGIGAGLLLTSGTTPGTTNTVGWFGSDNSGSSGFNNGDADINAVVNTVFQTQSYDATSLAFDFTVADPTATSISFDIVFGSDEYPEWVDAFVDSAIVMVNGVNYALFNHDPNHPLSVVSSNLAAGYFQDNASNALPIEYDGVSHVLKIVAPINGGGANNQIKIAIADTGDHVYDSGIFISNLSAGSTPGSGVVSVTPPGSTTENNDVITGSAQDEYIDLKGGDDIAYAGAGDDIIVAGAGNDSVYGGSGNDQMKGDAGNDYLDGGDGLDDTAVFSGASTEYGLVYDAGTATYTVTDSKTGSTAEGIDTLKNVEFAKFSNGLFTVTTSGLGSVAAPPPPPTNTPGFVLISGVTSVGNVLTATVSDPDGFLSGAIIIYQWQISSNGGNWSNIGTNSNTYTITQADVGNQIQVIASYTDSGSVVEAPVSAPQSILDIKSGDLVVTLMQLKAPLGASSINPLTTLVQNAIDLGLSPNTAAIAIKTVLGLPSNINLQNYDAYGVLQTSPTNAQALTVEKIAVQVAILTSLSDDDTGLNLTAKILSAAASNKTLNLANANDLASILGVNINGILDKKNYPQPLREIFDRNSAISEAIADGDDISAIEQEWQDLLSIQDGINSTSIADLSIHINQAPIGAATADLAPGTEGTPYSITTANLLIGFSDPDGGILSVTDLSANIAGTFTNNPSNIWTFTPDSNYKGPVELTYTVIDGQGGSTSANQLFVIAPLSNLPTFTGNANANTLIGTTGAEMLIGLGGNDTYTVNHAGDIVVEAFNEGTDTVKTTIFYTLTDNVENLTLLGTNNIDGTGNDLNNTVTGNTGNNILIGLGGNDIIDGKAGADTMQGGLGNDTYTIDNVGDLVTEALNQGTDSVKTTISYVLTDNVEKLTLLGTNNIDGTGNDLNNTLTGNTGNNTLMGLGGVDTIVGGAGNDILVGGTGKDTLTGGLGSDKFGYQTLGDSLLSGYDVIKDFNATTDVFFVATTPTLFTANAGNVTSLTENNIKGILTNNILANNGDTAQFSYGSRTFLAINNSISGFQANADTLIELTTAGLIGSLNLSNFVLS